MKSVHLSDFTRYYARTMPQACGILMHYRGFVEKI